jgi:DNA-binding NarL/FixJ family response regulator
VSSLLQRDAVVLAMLARGRRPDDSVERLTSRQREVLALMAQGRATHTGTVLRLVR